MQPRPLLAMLALVCLAATALPGCGGDDDGSITIPGANAATPPAENTIESFGGLNAPLTSALLRASFPNLRLAQPTEELQSSVRNGPQLSDAQLSAGAQSEVNLDFGGRDGDSSIAYDLFTTPAAASAWYQRFSLGLYGQYKLHGSYAPKGISNAKCEQFADTSAGRNTGGTQCFALDKNVVVYGESIVYDTPSGNQQDAEALLKAAVSYFDSLK